MSDESGEEAKGPRKVSVGPTKLDFDDRIITPRVET